MFVSLKPSWHFLSVWAASSDAKKLVKQFSGLKVQPPVDETAAFLFGLQSFEWGATLRVTFKPSIELSSNCKLLCWMGPADTF